MLSVRDSVRRCGNSAGPSAGRRRRDAMATGAAARRGVQKENKHVPRDVQRLAVSAAISTIVQSALWICLSATAVCVYTGWLEVADWRSAAPGTQGQGMNASSEAVQRYPRLLAHLYFMETPMPLLPEEGLLPPSQMYLWMEIILTAGSVWLFTSAGVFAAVRLASAAAGFFWVYCWLAATGAMTLLDVMLAALMARDFAVLVNWDALDRFPGESTALLLCPALIMVAALRGGLLLIFNAVCMVRVALAVSNVRIQRKEAEEQLYRAPNVEDEGPIDAYLHRNSGALDDGLGTRNPAFSSDVDRWSSFRPPPDEQHGRERGSRGQRWPRTSRDDEDDFQHLSWMEEVDKHVTTDGRQADRMEMKRIFSRDAQHDTPRDSFRSRTSQSTVAIPRARVQPKPLVYIPQPDYTPPTRRSRNGLKDPTSRW